MTIRVASYRYVCVVYMCMCGNVGHHLRVVAVSSSVVVIFTPGFYSRE